MNQNFWNLLVKRESNFGFYVLMILAMIGWGGSWVSAKLGSHFDPIITAFWRNIVSALIFIPILLILRDKFTLKKEAILWTLLSGLMMAIYNLLFLWGIQFSDAGYGGVLVPSFNALFGFLIVYSLKIRPFSIYHAIALFLGLCGCIFQIIGPQFDFSRLGRIDNVIFVSSAFIYALMTFFASKAQVFVSVFNYSFWLSCFAIVFTLPMAFFSPVFNVEAMPPNFWLDVLYLAGIAGVFGTSAYFFAAKKLGSARGGSFTFLVPFTSLILGVLILGEKPEITSIIGGILASVAVFLIQFWANKKV